MCKRYFLSDHLPSNTNNDNFRHWLWEPIALQWCGIDAWHWLYLNLCWKFHARYGKNETGRWLVRIRRKFQDNKTWATGHLNCMHILHSSTEHHHVGATPPWLYSPLLLIVRQLKSGTAKAIFAILAAPALLAHPIITCNLKIDGLMYPIHISACLQRGYINSSCSNPW